MLWQSSFKKRSKDESVKRGGGKTAELLCNEPINNAHHDTIFDTTLHEANIIDLHGLSVKKGLSSTPVVNDLAKTTSRRLGLLSFPHTFTESNHLQSYDSPKNGICQFCLNGGSYLSSMLSREELHKFIWSQWKFPQDSTAEPKKCHRSHGPIFHGMFYCVAPELLHHLLSDRSN